MNQSSSEYSQNPELATVSGRQRIESLAASGDFVFHGSPVAGIEEFEPRQAHDFDSQKKEKIPDEEPAVFATKIPDIAIFHAIVNSHNKLADEKSSLRGTSIRTNAEGETTVTFRATPGLLAGAKLPSAHGVVYVFRAAEFEQREKKPGELRSLKKIKPVESIEVSARDLPRDIEEIQPPDLGK